VIGWREEIGGARLAFTDRDGGVSRRPYDSLNLGGHVGDDPQAVAENRRRVAAAFDISPTHLLFMEQVHGRDVAVVDGPWPVDQPLPRVDALVTASPEVAVAVLVADCAPVLVVDPVAGVVAAAHAGRPGLAAGIVDATLDAMSGAGADLDRCVARVGPSVCAACYEVPEALRAEVAHRVPAARAVTRHGTPALDVPGGVLAQLSARVPDVAWVGPCTRETASQFSYRRERATGRSAGVVRAARG
jgi:hypothetical protein